MAIIRSLGKSGVPVTAIDHRERMPGSYSNHITTRLIARHADGGDNDKVGSRSNWRFSANQALDRLRELGPRSGGVLIPTNDDYCLLVAKNHAELSQWFTLTIPPWETIAPFFSKRQVQQLARDAGVDVPAWYAPADFDAAQTILSGLDFNDRAWIFKLDPWSPGPCDPVSGAMTRPAGGSASVAIQNYREVADRVALPMIQEVVPGDASVCVGVTMLIDRQGVSHGAFCIQRLLLQTYATGGEQIHPYELGANIYAESCHDEEAIAAAKEIMKGTGFYGVATVEFRRRRSDNALFFMKVDPRFVNATGLSAAIGMDMPIALYQMATGGSFSFPAQYPAGVGWIWADRSIRTILRNRDRVPLITQLKSMMLRLRNVRAWAYFNFRDPRPVLRAWQMEAKWQISRVQERRRNRHRVAP